MAVPEIGHRSRDNAIALIGGNARTDPYRDGPAQKTKRRCAGLPVGNRSIACGARRRLERLYDRADLRAIGSTDAHLLATLTLAHWLYVRATAARPYSWRKMASDYRFNLLTRAGCRRRDVRAMPRHSRPQIARRILIARYLASRKGRNIAHARRTRRHPRP